MRPKLMRPVVPERIHADQRGPTSHSILRILLAMDRREAKILVSVDGDLRFASPDRIAFASKGRSWPLASILPRGTSRCCKMHRRCLPIAAPELAVFKG